jgi:hypothetical protein
MVSDPVTGIKALGNPTDPDNGPINGIFLLLLRKNNELAQKEHQHWSNPPDFSLSEGSSYTYRN